MEIDYTCKNYVKNTVIHPWMMIDVSGKPELLEQIKDETIHVIFCPDCNDQVSIQGAITALR